MARENPGWDSRDYLKFERERTLPCRDLVRRVELESPRKIVDLGCGPGNSTAVLSERWPEAQITGVDSSPEMLKAAKASKVRADWVLEDIRKWNPGGRIDLLFSNAALQWIPDHETELPRLFALASAGGALAFQIPSGEGEWVNALRRVAESERWTRLLGGKVWDLTTHDLRFYYRLFSPLSDRLEMWQTSYVHVLPDPTAVLDWTKGTALRPFLEILPEEHRESFENQYLDELKARYPLQRNGKVLFPFLRRFVIVYKE